MTFADIRDVQTMSTDDVRRLSCDGEPRERLWAVWTLGLRGPKHYDWIARRARLDPAAGVRSHLVVAVAGIGRVDTLWAMSQDHDESVCAAALHWLTRLAQPDDTITWDRIMPRLATGSTLVRESIIAGLPRRLPPAVDAMWLRHLDDPAPEVRYIVLARVSANKTLSPDLRARLTALRGVETHPTVRRRIDEILGLPLDPRRSRPGLQFPLLRM